MGRKKELVSLSDEALMRAFGLGEGLAREILLARYRERLFDFFCSKVSAVDADDLAQKALDVLDARLRGGEALVSLRGFAYGVGRRLLLHFCSARAGARVFDPEVHSLVDLDSSVSRQLSRHRRVQWLRIAMAELPVETQTLLELRYVQELTYSEIAEIYQVPVGTAVSRVRLAKERLTEMRAAKDRPLTS